MTDVGATVELELKVAISEPLGTETLLFTSIGDVEIQRKMLNLCNVENDEILRFVLSVD